MVSCAGVQSGQELLRLPAEKEANLPPPQGKPGWPQIWVTRGIFEELHDEIFPAYLIASVIRKEAEELTYVAKPPAVREKPRTLQPALCLTLNFPKSGEYTAICHQNFRYCQTP